MTNERRTRHARVLLAAAAVAVCALVWAPTAAIAKDTGISGTVVNGTTEEPVAGLEVTLTMFDSQTQVGTLPATTDADGAFAFPTPVELTQNYQLEATYADVLYRSPIAPYTQGEPAKVELSVFDTTTDTAEVAVTNWTVWVDQEGDGAAVQHTVTWGNTGDTAFIGTEQVDGMLVTTQLPVEPGARNPQFLDLYLDYPGKIVGDTYVNPQAILPGSPSATLRYSLPDLTSLTLPITLPTTNLQLLVPTGVTVTADGLTPSGQTTEGQTTYQVFIGQDLQPGDTIAVSLDGLTGSSGGVSPVLWVGIGIVIVAALVGVIVWLVLRGRSAQRSPARTTRAATRTRAPQDPAKNGQTRSTAATRRTQVAQVRTAERNLDEQADLLIDEIAALDLAFEKGLLEQHSYESLRSAAKERLLRLREAPAEEEGASR
jgi:hypothetical protein